MDDPRYRVELDVSAGRGTGAAPTARDPDTPFHVAILGDFTGRGSRTGGGSAPPLPDRSAVSVDRDDLDDVLRRFAPTLALSLDDGPPVSVSFAELEDFHPDALHERLPMFGELERLWESLSAPPPEAPAPDEGPLSLDLSGGGFLDQVVAASGGGEPGRAAASADPLQRFIRRALAGHVRPSEEDPGRRADRDAARARLMEAVLHHPAFRALEAAWRGVDFLVRRVETGPRLKLFLVDVTLDELRAEAADADQAAEPGLTRLLERNAQGPFGPVPWSLLVGLYDFGDTPDDVGVLAHLSGVARRAGAPLVAGAGPTLVGLQSFEDAAERIGDASSGPPEDGWEEADPSEGSWHRFRRGAGASWVGLAGPRFLVRAPYGGEGELCDLRGFVESPSHEGSAWCNSAILVALLLARDFDQHGWAMRPGRNPSVDGLPLHVYRSNGETRTRPIAETVMTDRLADALAGAGLIPVAWARDAGSVQILRIRSVATSDAPLPGGWAAAAG